MMRPVITFLALAFMATAAVGEPNEIGFADLADPAARDFEDPFAAMGTDDLLRLKLVVRLRERLEAETVAAESRPNLEARIVEASAALAAAGHDIDLLVGRRWEIAEKRRNAMFATNPALDGQAVTLSGYLIPAPADEDGTEMGYLVSAVGLCSHFPPPPPNQLVRVRLAGAELPKRTTLYTPVRFGGTLRADSSDQTVFVLDGDVRMISMWTLDAGEAVLLGPAATDASGVDARDPLFARELPDRLGRAGTGLSEERQ